MARTHYLRSALLLLIMLVVTSIGCSRSPLRLISENDASDESRMSRWVRCYAYWASAEVRDLRDELRRIRSRVQSLPPYSPQMNLVAGFHSGYAETQDAERWVQVDLGETKQIDIIALIPAFVRRDDVNVAGYGFPRRFRVEVALDPDCKESEIVFEAEEEDVENPGKYPFLISDIEAKGRYVRMTSTRLAVDGDHAFFALGEFVVLSGNRNVAQWRPLQASGTVEAELRWSIEYLVDGVSVLPLPTFRQLSPTDGFQSRAMPKADSPVEVVVDLGESFPIDEIRLIPALPMNRPDIPGWGFPRRFRVELLSELDETPAKVYQSVDELRHWTHGAYVIPTGSCDYFLARPPRSLASTDPPWELPPKPQEARYIRIVSERLDGRVQGYYFALAEVQAYAGEANVALNKNVEVTRGNQTYDPDSRWNPTFLTDGFSSRRRLQEWPAWLLELDELRQAERRMAEADDAYFRAVAKVWSWNLWSGALILMCGLVWAVAFNYQLKRRHRRTAEQLRNQIASDLHDDIGSNLGTIGLLCESVRNESLTENEKVALQEIREIAVETGDAMRDILWIIDPTSTRLEDFIGRLRQISKRLLASQEIEFTSPVEIPNEVIPLPWRRNVFLSVKEVLHNAAKHSQAELVKISVDAKSRFFLMEIVDDGVGFDVNARSSGFGLRNISRRIRELGGVVQYESTAGEGTIVKIRAPLPTTASGTDQSPG